MGTRKPTATNEGDAQSPAFSSLLKRGSFLVLSLALLQLVLGGLAYSANGLDGFTASLVAMLSCLVGGLVALLIGDLAAAILRAEVVAFAQAVLGMLVRAAFGLGVCVVAYGFALPISKSGLVYYVLAFYMLTLAVETAFAVRNLGGSVFSVSAPTEK